MYSIQDYVNPYDSMPPPPERFVVGPYVFEEVKVKDGKIVFPEGIENAYPQTDIIELKIKKNKTPKETNMVNKIAKSSNVSKLLKAVKSLLFLA